MFKPLATLPPVSRDPLDILRLFGPESLPIQRVAQRALGTEKWILGCDLEYREPERYREQPTVLGVSDGHLTVSVPFEEGLPFFQELRAQHPNILFVGHAFTSADKFAFRQVGVEIMLEDIEDTIIRFYLANSHLCKTGVKVEDGDGEKRGKGYMNLWTFLSLYTDFYNYKECWGKQCRREFCPTHDVWGYNGADSSGPIYAIPTLITQSKMRGVDKLYTLHRDLAYVLGEMSRYGVQIDRPYVEKLQGDFEKGKERIEEQLPFNPKSGKAALDYFKKKDILLSDWQETTIREAVEKYEDEELALSLDYKELGNGTDRWFAPVTKDSSGDWVGYMDDRGKIHPRLGMFTSTGRLQCTSPNLQNVAKRRVDRHVCECGLRKEDHLGLGHDFKGASLGKMVRRAIIASPGHYLIKADYSNAENRVFLFLGGHHIPNTVDLHLTVSDIAQLTPEMEFSIRLGGPREAAKSIQHAGNYLEGLQLKTPAELKSPRVRSEIEQGARLVFPDWKFNGKVVTFTGANLAGRAFGDKSFKNRAKALEVASKYFGGFPGARDLQQRIGKQIEQHKAVITPHGYYLLSFGDDEERYKTAAAMWGSNPVAHLTKLSLVDLWRKFDGGRPLRPILQVHDEIICEVPNHIHPEEASEWLGGTMEIETPEIPGLILPIGNPSKRERAAYGPNWSDTKAVKI